MASPIDCPGRILDFTITTTNDEGIEILALTQDLTATKSLKVFDYPSKKKQLIECCVSHSTLTMNNLYRHEL